jgi:hypothetical protein
VAGAVGVICSLTVTVRARAQDGIKLQIGGGVAIPTARFDTTYTSGPAALVAITNGGSESPLGLRLDYSYNGFKGKTIAGRRYRDAHMNVVTGDLVFSLHTGPYIKPYVLGGAGWYPYREATDTKRRNEWGANAGAGITFPFPLQAGSGFLEARLHRVFGGGTQARRFVPIILGVTL